MQTKIILTVISETGAGDRTLYLDKSSSFELEEMDGNVIFSVNGNNQRYREKGTTILKFMENIDIQIEKMHQRDTVNPVK